MTSRWVFCGALVAAVAVACSSKSADENYSTAYAKAICDSLAPCCMANGFTFDGGQCNLGGAGFVQSGNDAAKKSGAMFDQKSADACVAAIRTLAASCKSGADDPAATPPANVCGWARKRQGPRARATANARPARATAFA